MIRPWRPLLSRSLADYQYFSVRRDTVLHPDGDAEYDFYLIEMPDLVHVIPVLQDGRVALVRQYRHAARMVTLEVPAGHVQPDEAPEAAARRELLEETGLAGGTFTLLSAMRPSAARMTNRDFYFLASEVQPGDRPEPDHSEETEVEIVPRAGLDALVADGRIIDTHTACAFYLFAQHERAARLQYR